MFVIVAYDIQDDKKRNKVFKTLKNYGQWMQFSVFECQNLSKENFLHMRNKVEKYINEKKDSIRYYILCDNCYEKVIRIGGVKECDETIFFA